MEIKKVETITVTGDDGQEIKAGDTIKFLHIGRTVLGKFIGLGKAGIIVKDDITGEEYTAKSKSIGGLYKI